MAQGDGSELDIFYTQQKQLKDALEILIHPSKRRSYDLFLQSNQENASLPDSVEDFWSIILPTKAPPSLQSAIELSQSITKLDISGEYLGKVEEYDEQVTATHIPKETVYNELEVDKRSSENPSRKPTRPVSVVLEKDSEATQVSPKRDARLDDNPTELFEKSPRLQQTSQNTSKEINICSFQGQSCYSARSFAVQYRKDICRLWP